MPTSPSLSPNALCQLPFHPAEYYDSLILKSLYCFSSSRGFTSFPSMVSSWPKSSGPFSFSYLLPHAWQATNLLKPNLLLSRPSTSLNTLLQKASAFLCCLAIKRYPTFQNNHATHSALPNSHTFFPILPLTQRPFFLFLWKFWSNQKRTSIKSHYHHCPPNSFDSQWFWLSIYY